MMPRAGGGTDVFFTVTEVRSWGVICATESEKGIAPYPCGFDAVDGYAPGVQKGSPFRTLRCVLWHSKRSRGAAILADFGLPKKKFAGEAPTHAGAQTALLVREKYRFLGPALPENAQPV